MFSGTAGREHPTKKRRGSPLKNNVAFDGHGNSLDSPLAAVVSPTIFNLGWVEV